MKITYRISCMLAGFIALSAVGQQSNEQGTPSQTLPPGLQKRDELPPGLEKRDELPPGLAKRTNQVTGGISAGGTNTLGATANRFGAGTTNSLGVSAAGTTTNRLTPTGRESGSLTNQTTARAQAGAAGQLRIQAVTTTDQPIVTEIQRVLTTETVLTPVLPLMTIQVNGGVVVLEGDVQCGAEKVLVQNIIQQRVPRVVRIDNRLRLPAGAFTPAIR